MNYNENPVAITETSFEMIGRELDEMGIVVDAVARPLIVRMVHSSADFDFATITVWSDGAIAAGIAALDAGCPIVTDVNMVRIGINAKQVEAAGCTLHCFVNDPEAHRRAPLEATTRSVMGMRLAREQGLLDGAVVAIGNAPTALFELIKMVADGVRPALIIGMPVGFVGAVESKDALTQVNAVPWMTTVGRKGGSPVTVAAVNALLRMTFAEEAIT